MEIELTNDETAFLKSIIGQVVPNMQVPAKDAPAILEMCNSILIKMEA